MIAELSATLAALATDNKTRVLILASEGRSFSAGADLGWMKKTATYTEAANQQDAEQLSRMLKALDEFPAPTIARVHGAAFGGGVGLVACCDVAVAATGAIFSLSEVRLGLIPATISPFVIAAIGSRAARRYFLSAERFDAATALSLGLVHAMCDATRLDHTIDELVEQLLLGSPAAQRQSKALIRDVRMRSIDDNLVVDTAARIAAARASADGREGVDAFLEKRKPHWIDSND